MDTEDYVRDNPDYVRDRDNQDYVRDKEITRETEITKIMLEIER